MNRTHIRFVLVLAAALVALALSSSAEGQQADEDPSPDRSHPQQQPAEKAHAPAQPTPNLPSADPQTQEALAFTGIIGKVQGEIVLKDPVTKMVYKFDEPSKVEPYVGRQVKVVGKLALNCNTIHVNSIQVIPHDENRPAEKPRQSSSSPPTRGAR